MMKSMAVWENLVDKVFLSIYMSKYMEHGKLNHLLFHNIRYKWIHVSQSLGSQNSVYSNRNVLPTIQYKYPFGEFASFDLFWGVETKNDDLRRYFQRKSNRWDAVTNLLLAEKRQKELRGLEWVKRGYEKKRDEAKQVKRIWTAPPIRHGTPSHLTIVRSEKKWRFQNFLLSKLQIREGYLTQRKQVLIDTLLLSRGN